MSTYVDKIVLTVVCLFTLCQIAAPSAFAADRDTVTIGAVGDIMMGSDFPEDKLPPRDGADLFREAADVLRSVDIAFGNLEGPLLKGGQTTKVTASGRVYAYRTPPRYARLLQNAGFDVLSLANNHSHDFGTEGLQSTKRALKEHGLQYSSKNGEVAKFQIGRLRVGLIAISTGPGPRTIVNPAPILKEIRELAPQYDILIVSAHAGGEGPKFIHIRNEQEFYLGENRGNLVEFSRNAIDAGADLILAHGPHVPRAMEIYKDRLIAYSLGNFATYRGFNLSNALGLAPLLELKLDSQGRLIQGYVHSFQQTPPGGPKADERQLASRFIERVSKEDFPDSSPEFDGQGGFKPRHPVSGLRLR